MCEFCTKHGDGKVWYKNAANYGNDLFSDIKRRKYIEDFHHATMEEGFKTLGRLETLFTKRGRLPASVITALEQKAKVEHFGQVLPIEEISDLVLKAESVVRLPCACRWTISRKEERCCFALSYGPDAWYKGFDMSYFGKASDEGLETVRAEDAVAQMDALEDSGAIHSIWTMMTPFIGAVCNCTASDCIGLRTLFGIGAHTIARAEYVAVVDNDLCAGCGLCMERCQFDAITSNESIAAVDPGKCYGCGLCRKACDQGAISLVMR
ncbi:MAG TPA: 4Fe-4S binding protein [Dissulfurispiraceae bacterium]|nr:4Fe-4S binding protein [Dissulfurispiraceae bacterium]